MAGISSPGIGSGLDVNNIVTSLVEAERSVFDKRYEANNIELTEKISAFGTIKSTMSELSDVLFDLKLSTTFSKRKTEFSSSAFELEVGSAAQPGNFTLDVQNLAASHKITSQAFTSTEAIGAGTLDISVGAANFSFEIDSDDNINDIRTKINSDPAAAEYLNASVINGDDGTFLVIESAETGLANTVQIAVTDADAGVPYDNAGLSRLAFSVGKATLDNSFATGEVIGQDGSFTITNGTESQTINVLNTDAIEDVVNKINTSGLNLTASLEDDGAGGNRLILASANAYPDNEISIVIDADGDGDLANSSGVSKFLYTGSEDSFNQITAASDASIVVNGSITATSSTNEFSGVLDGVIIDAKSVTTSSVNVEVSLDKESTSEQINLLVEKFNALIEKMDEYSKVNIEDQTSGILTGDSTIRQIVGRVRNAFSNPVTLADGSAMSLSQLGITTNRDGTIAIDATKLDEGISNNFEQFGEFFAGDEGLAKNLYNVVNEYDKFQGLIDKRIDGFRALGDEYDERKEAFDSKMNSYETRLYAQFLAMDKIVAQLNATGDFLDQQLDNLPGSAKKD